MGDETPNWPVCIVQHSWRRLNENDKTKVYVAGVSTMVKDQLFLTKWESMISVPDAVCHAYREMFKKVSIHAPL